MRQTAGIERFIKWVVSAVVTAFFLSLCAVHDRGQRGHELYIRNWLGEPVTVSGVVRGENGCGRRFLLEAMPDSLTDAYVLPRLTFGDGGELTFETGHGPLPYRVPLEFHRIDPTQNGPIVVSLYPNRSYVTQGVPSSARPLPLDLTLERLLMVVAVFGGTFTFLRWMERQTYVAGA